MSILLLNNGTASWSIGADGEIGDSVEVAGVVASPLLAETLTAFPQATEVLILASLATAGAVRCTTTATQVKPR